MSSKGASVPRAGTPGVPLLEEGMRLSREEFEVRYSALPELKKAELIEGVVYVPSPARAGEHAGPQARIITWLGVYAASTPGVQALDNATVRLDPSNEPQPDGCLRIDPAAGGQSLTSADGYVERAPELVAEVSSSTASYDLGPKLRAFERNGVREYLVWRVLDGAIDWFFLEEGKYRRLEADPRGVHRSRVFPGLWLDAPAMVRGDMARVLAVLSQGLASPEHADWVALRGPRPPRPS